MNCDGVALEYGKACIKWHNIVQLDQGLTVQSKVELLTACQRHTKWLYQLDISSIFGLIRSRVGCYAQLLSNSSSSKCLPLKAGTKPYFKENSQGSIKLSVFTTQNKSSSGSTTHVLEFYIFRLNYIQTYLEVPKLNVFNNPVQWLKTIDLYCLRLPCIMCYPGCETMTGCHNQFQTDWYFKTLHPVSQL